MPTNGTKKTTNHRGKPLARASRRALKELARHLGPAAAANKIGISRTTFDRAILGGSLYAGNLALIRRALAAGVEVSS